jgi:phosphohistidine phosphatase
LNGLEGPEKVAIVGHEPFLSGFASYCLSKSKSSYIKLKKGGILMLEMEGALKPGQCRLAWLMEPWQIIELS